MNRLDRAIEAFDDDDDIATFEDKLLNLGSALNWNVKNLIKSIKTNGLKSKITEEQEYVHITCMRLYKDMEKIHNSMTKILKNSGKNASEIDTKWRDEMRKVPSSLSSIVRDLNKAS